MMTIDQRVMKVEDYAEEIEKYFKENGLDFKKLEGLYRGRGTDFIGYQHEDEDGKVGTWEPMPIVLLIEKDGDKLRFEQTEYTKRYLAADE